LAVLLATVPVASASDGHVDWRTLLRGGVAQCRRSEARHQPLAGAKAPADEQKKPKPKTTGDHRTGTLRGSLAVAAGLVGGVYLLATSNQDVRRPYSSVKQERSTARVAGGVAAIVAESVIALKMAVAGNCD